MIYVCETWAMNLRKVYTVAKLRVTVSGVKRRYLLNITRNDRETKTTKFPDVIEMAHLRKWTWTGHMVRRTEDSSTRKIM